LPGGGIDRRIVAVQRACNAYAHCNVHAHGIANQRISVTREFRRQLDRTDTTTHAEFASNGVCPGRALRRGVPERGP
jgi:hypothetical protein